MPTPLARSISHQARDSMSRPEVGPAVQATEEYQSPGSATLKCNRETRAIQRVRSKIEFVEIGVSVAIGIGQVSSDRRVNRAEAEVGQAPPNHRHHRRRIRHREREEGGRMTG